MVIYRFIKRVLPLLNLLEKRQLYSICFNNFHEKWRPDYYDYYQI